MHAIARTAACARGWLAHHGIVACVESETPVSVAGRWFGVRAEFERVSRLSMLWRTIKWLMFGFVTLGLTMGDFDPKRFCDVIVFRRDTGQAVATFSYDFLSEASPHVEDLVRRLASAHVYDFCRELGVGTESVVGPGFSELFDSTVVWQEVAAERRGTGDRAARTSAG
jgi:hypothetical protein